MNKHLNPLRRRRASARTTVVCLAALSLAGMVSSPASRAFAQPSVSAPVTTRYSITQIVGSQGRRIFPTSISSDNRIAGIIESGQVDQNEFPIYHAFVRNGNSLTVLPTLGGDNSRAFGVNSSGDVVGEAQRPDGSYHAFLWRGSQMIDLGQVIGDQDASSALGINNAGQVVGTLGPEYFGEAYVWSQSAGLTTLGPGSARGINAHGEVVGATRDDEGTTYPAVWQNGQAVRLPDLGNNLNNYASAINDSGVIVGAAQNPAEDIVPVLWKLGPNGYTLTQLGNLPKPPGFETHYGAALSINNAGQVVGQSNFQAFIWQSNQIAPLAQLVPPQQRFLVTMAAAINHLGSIAGEGLAHVSGMAEWQQRGALITPSVPPASGAELSGAWDTSARGRKLPVVKLVGRGRTQKYTITGTFILKNTGDVTAKSPKVGFYLSNDGDPNNPVPNLGLLKTYPSIVKRGSRALVISVSIPVSQGVDPRGKHIVAVIDPLDAIGEQDETNNTVVYGPLQ